MPYYLQRVRFTVHTKDQRFAGTNSTVSLCYKVEEKHNHPNLEPGIHSTVLDHPWHDDFKSGKSDSYEVNFGVGRVGRNFMGRPILNGLVFETLDDARKMQFALKIEGTDQWIFDRYKLGGFFMEVRSEAEVPAAKKEIPSTGAIPVGDDDEDEDEDDEHDMDYVEAEEATGSHDEGDNEEIEIGWLEMARHSGDIEMSSDPNEGYAEYPIQLNGSFQ